MRARAVIIAAAIAAPGMAGCGSAAHPQREELAAYLRHVATIEKAVSPSVQMINRVTRAISQPRASAGRPLATPTLPGLHLTPAMYAGRLDGAAARIRAGAVMLKALRVPRAERRLHGMLLALAYRQVDLAHQSARLVVFGPAFSRALKPLGPSVTKLERILSVNRAYGATAVQAVYQQKTLALRSFVTSLSRILAELKRLRPPRSSLPTLQNEQSSLAGMSTAAARLATALSTGQVTRVPLILSAFDSAAAIPGSTRAQKQEIAAVKAYDREIGSLNTLVGQINRERSRLATATGGAGV